MESFINKDWMSKRVPTDVWSGAIFVYLRPYILALQDFQVHYFSGVAECGTLWFSSHIEYFTELCRTFLRQRFYFPFGCHIQSSFIQRNIKYRACVCVCVYVCMRVLNHKLFYCFNKIYFKCQKQSACRYVAMLFNKERRLKAVVSAVLQRSGKQA